jgi:glycosyltransferase involved in cell wall biosynthesis
MTDHFEILMVEDCGGDNSWEIIEAIAAKDRRVRGIQFNRNFGQHAATICGIAHATGEWVVTLDDDLEQNPEDITALYAKAQEGYDLVYGVYEARSHSRWRNFSSELARTLFRIAIPSLNDAYTSFRIMRRHIAEALPRFDSPYPFIDGYLSWITNRYGTVTVEHGTRYQGVSNYTLKKLITHTTNIFVTFSDLPLKIATYVGLGSALIGLVTLLVVLLVKIFGGITVSGYASLMASIVLFGGLQMFILGIMGEYLGRINFKTSRKPLYLIARETKTESE